ncbi:hypothetical protein FUAX_25510 [Fulvitalea axinellae]|uniref:FAD dependent oxidoreductase n=1 Tax=Fulvitalea axinellae TaxID=1182444 RepID=A0AAU9CUH8_9BACT|nr:hypothetical protein FUAX_25510 [Fulvitalea axinellae]
MIRKEVENNRSNKEVKLDVDLVVAGGGLSGVCAAVVAARQGQKVVLIQDRPVLGGNASSEVRLWALGATSHMGNNNRWSREGGLINEILLDNLKRNKEGNALIFDTILLEKVLEEKNIKLLLNTAVYEVRKSGDRVIESVRAFCSQNSTGYTVSAPFFCDASGDGIVSFLAGASFRMGAEKAEEFDEGFAPNIEDYGDLLGHSLYFYTKDTGKPVTFTAPSFAIKNASELPRIKNYKFQQHGCKLWWVEYGGRLDTIHESEDIKMELWKVVYGIWDHVKNSGEYPEAENLTLEWVGTVPGKRESRRFNGDYMLSQKDIVEQRDHYDRVLFGGWAMDLHPADGIYSKHNSCSQWHGKGVYSIPYRCLYSRDMDNLFLAGRIISASHVAFGSTRIMLTCAMTGQVAGMASRLCKENNWTARQLSEENNIGFLQLELNKAGQSIPRLKWNDEEDLAQKATVKASSGLDLKRMEENGEWQTLEFSVAQLLPLKANTEYAFKLKVRAKRDCVLETKMRISDSPKHFTPERTLQTLNIPLVKGEQNVDLVFDQLGLEEDRYAYLTFMNNPDVELVLTEERISGILTVQQKINKDVSNYGKQEPPEGLGLDAFEFWTPERRPGGKNLALSITPGLDKFQAGNSINCEIRPLPDGEPNAWVAAQGDLSPELTLSWSQPQEIKRLRLFFDPDFDHALECNQMGHPESEIPFVVSDYKVLDCGGNVIYEKKGNYQAINDIELESAVTTDSVRIILSQKHKHISVSLFKVSVYRK